MTLKQIVDALFAGKMVGNSEYGYMFIDTDGELVALRKTSGFDCDDHLIGFLFCSCDNLEVSE